MGNNKLLEIKNLCIQYKTDDGVVHAVQNLNLSYIVYINFLFLIIY